MEIGRTLHLLKLSPRAMVALQVPARICFFGDHQDYLGLPVIAGTIDRFIKLQAIPNATQKFILHLEDLDSTITIALDDSLENIHEGDYFRSAMAVLKRHGFSFNLGYTITITSDIPINAGLSSSSALTVAWIRFLTTSQKGIKPVNDLEIGRWAYAAEVEYFGQPGGLMDQFTIAQGGLLYIDTQTGATERLKNHMGTLVVAESGIPKKTLAVLKNARVYAQNAIAAVQKMHPEYEIVTSKKEDYDRYRHLIAPRYHDHWYATIHNYQITKRAKALLTQNADNREELGQLMDRHQGILQDQIQNTPRRMIAMMDAAREAGAIGVKTIGSGGGGCMVAMVTKENKDGVITAFLHSGATKAYEVNLIGR